MTVSERNPTPSNRLGLDGLEFVEFTTTQPLVLGALLERMGFRAVARHRSREVLLYRQGGMNLVVNAHPGVVHAAAGDEPVTAVGAMAFRVADAGEAHRQTVALGAWDLPSRAAAMELIIPGIRGAGDSHIYFVDRHRDFSIYDVDFTPIVGTDPHPPALAGLHYFGLVQTAFPERTAAWLEFYRSLFGFTVLPSGQFFGVVNKGVLLESPCRKFFLQLIEPPDDSGDVAWEEGLLRIGLGTRHGARRDRGPAGAGHRLRRPWPHPPDRSRRAHPALSRRRRLRAGSQPARGLAEVRPCASPTSAWTPSRWPGRSKPSSGPSAPPGSRRSCCRRATWSVTPTASRPRSRPCARAGCGSRASRSCATSRG